MQIIKIEYDCSLAPSKFDFCVFSLLLINISRNYTFVPIFCSVLVNIWIPKFGRFMWWVWLEVWGEGGYSRGGLIKH